MKTEIELSLQNVVVKIEGRKIDNVHMSYVIYHYHKPIRQGYVTTGQQTTYCIIGHIGMHPVEN
jgi:hypothetical protein